MKKILTGKEQFTSKKFGGYRQFVHYLLRSRGEDAPNWKMCDDPVIAWVNQGNWAANCECGGSMIVEPGEPYICPDCANAKQGGLARPVIWPDDRESIEAVLVERPFPKNRNWLAHETVEMLVDQNMEHGDEVPAEILKRIKPPKEELTEEPPMVEG